MRYYSFLSVDLTVRFAVWVCVIDVLLTCCCEGSHAPVEPVPATHLLLTQAKKDPLYAENSRDGDYSGIKNDSFSESIYLHTFKPPLPLSLFLLYHLCHVSFNIAEQKPEVNLGHNWIVVKGREQANNSDNTTPHRPLASMSTDTFCQHIYSHSHVVPHPQTGPCAFRLFWSPSCFIKRTSFPEWASHLGFGKQYFPWTPHDNNFSTGRWFLT